MVESAPGGQKAIGAEQGEAERTGDENEKAEMRRKAAKPGGGHLFGRGDRRQRETGDQIDAPMGRRALQRTKDRPDLPLPLLHGGASPRFT